MTIASEHAAVPLPPTWAASVVPGWADVTVGGHASASVDIGVGQALTAAHVLRVFEGLRRELSRHLIGGPGAFIGFDSLTLPRGAIPGPRRVIMEARLLDQTDRLHEVVYTAVAVSARTAHVAPRDPLLAHGTGRTLHVHT